MVPLIHKELHEVGVTVTEKANDREVFVGRDWLGLNELPEVSVPARGSISRIDIEVTFRDVESNPQFQPECFCQ